MCIIVISNYEEKSRTLFVENKQFPPTFIKMIQFFL